MDPALWIAKTGLDAQQTRMAVIANNLANANTPAFKRARVVFQDLLYQNVRQVGAQSSEDTRLPSGLMLGTGVRTVATEKVFSQGNLAQTGNPFDLAIQGRGFFQVLLPDGTLAYTRDGSFQIDSQGQLVTASGYVLQPPIQVPDNALSLTIGSDGTVSAKLPGSPQATQLGNLQLVDFVNPAGLEPIGNNLYVESAASGPPQAGTPGIGGLGTLNQGMVESSNVNVVEELVNMIEAQRAYEVSSRAIEAVDGMLEFATNRL